MSQQITSMKNQCFKKNPLRLTRFGWFCCSLLVLGCLTTTQLLQGAEIIAHRGASFDAPENTMAAVTLAWAQDADAVEIDVYLSKDGRIVPIHDSTPKRYGGPDRKISDMTWEEIQQLDVGNWKNSRFAGERVPDLENILKSVPAGRRLFIEVKCGPEIIPVLMPILKEMNRPASETCLISFNTAVIESATKSLPELERYWVVGMGSKDKLPPTAEELIHTTRRIGATALDLGGNTSEIDAPLMKKLQAAQIPCYVWTVNDPKEANRLVQLGVVGITTDKPAVLREAGIADAK